MQMCSEGISLSEQWTQMTQGALEVKDMQDIDFVPDLPLFY